MGRVTEHDARSVMFYCHDSYGLGHLRRTVTLARDFRARWPTITQLIVTGTAKLRNSPLLPEGADCVKLPAVVKVGSGQYESRFLSVPFDTVRDMRADILWSVAHRFRPDALIVDNVPAGLNGEMVPALRHLKATSPHTRLVLGLRDIVDEAPRVRQDWARAGVYDLLENVYDRILVYGDQRVYDVIREYGLSPRAAAKTRYVGYLRRERSARSPEQVRTELGLRTGRLALVTAGGGEDGYDLFRTLLGDLRRSPEAAEIDWLLVGGPLMSPGDRRRLLKQLPAGLSVRFEEFVEDLPAYVAAADVVVSMGGYNSVCEMLSLGQRSIVVPRVAPRKEQRIRAEALSERGLVRMVHPADLAPGRLLEEVTDALAQPARPPAPLGLLDGLPNVAAELDTVLPASRSRVMTRQPIALDSGVA